MTSAKPISREIGRSGLKVMQNRPMPAARAPAAEFGRHADETGKRLRQLCNGELPPQQDDPADGADNDGGAARQEQRHALGTRRGQRHFYRNFSH